MGHVGEQTDHIDPDTKIDYMALNTQQNKIVCLNFFFKALLLETLELLFPTSSLELYWKKPFHYWLILFWI